MCHLFPKLTNEEDKERRRRRGRWQGREVEGKERDSKLIRLEEHAGLNTLLMSTTKDSSCFSGGSWATLHTIQQGEVLEDVCICLCECICVKLTKVRYRLPWDSSVPSL